MKDKADFRFQFVEFIPPELEEKTLYISMEYATASHRCACGCGNEVVTPFSPTDWRLIFNGVAVSVEPSIGNWSFACQSHYWITRNEVEWAPKWSKTRVEYGRRFDLESKEKYFAKNDEPTPATSLAATETSFLKSLKKLVKGSRKKRR